jgi:hypothetical protein
MSSLPPVSPGSVPAASTESVGNGSASYDIESDLAAHIEQRELDQALPAEPGGHDEGPPGEDDDEDVEYDEGGVGQVSHPVSTFDASVYTAHQEFLRAASHYVSPMGYDTHSPSDWQGSAPYEPQPPVATESASPAPDYTGESVMEAFMRQSGLGASSMGYDVPTPNGLPDVPYSLGPLSTGSPEQVDMNDSTKRGRGDPPSPVPSSVALPPAKRSAAPASTGAGAASSQSASAPLPSQDAARLLALTREVTAMQGEREGMQARVFAAESAAQASIQRSEAAVLVVRAQLVESARQAEAFKVDLGRRHDEQLTELRAEAANYRAQTEAQMATMLDELRVAAEARHAEAMVRAEAGFAAKDAAREAQHAQLA